MFSREVPVPLQAMRTDLELTVKQGRSPVQTKEKMLQLLQLDGDKPDGLTLAARLMKSDAFLDRVCPLPSKNQMYALTRTLGLTEQLLENLEAHTENEGQLTVAKNMVAVAERQIAREGDICELATDLYLTLGQIRPDLVESSIYGPLVKKNIVEGMLESILGKELTRNSKVMIVDMRRDDTNDH